VPRVPRSCRGGPSAVQAVQVLGIHWPDSSGLHEVVACRDARRRSARPLSVLRGKFLSLDVVQILLGLANPLTRNQQPCMSHPGEGSNDACGEQAAERREGPFFFYFRLSWMTSQKRETIAEAFDSVKERRTSHSR